MKQYLKKWAHRYYKTSERPDCIIEDPLKIQASIAQAAKLAQSEEVSEVQAMIGSCIELRA